MKDLLSQFSKIRLNGYGIYLLVILLLAFLPAIIHSNSREFDQRIWQDNKNTSSSSNLRSQMIGDLQRRHLRVGMTRPQVQKLLGSPDQQEGEIDIYKVGYMIMSLDPTTLKLRYDNHNILIEFKTIEN